jgi:plasmid stabilization system protein ParE
MAVQLLEAAQSEYDQAVLYLEQRRKGLGSEFVEEFDRAVTMIQARPGTWPASSPKTRRYLMHRFSYLIHYLTDGDRITIVAVAHPSRRPGYWLDRI